ncbi:ATP-grasp domain-containing protein [bacterium]|nr:ATP-grasp domain-containing protein [bacterium]
MKKVLIANRGEITCRIIKSCQKLGLKTVVVYSDADKDAQHVLMADEAIHIGPGHAKKSYLVIENILAAAQKAQVDAIHPGYGFLAENADFAERVIAAGFIWIGPTPASISAMGDKQRARQLAIQAGVPVVPGSERFLIGQLDGLVEQAEKIGYPLLVKASAGGGGIGMRQVNQADKLLETVTVTQELAEKAFGDGTVYLEKLIPKARHIEVQVFGLGNGKAVHLYERDCSIQRRFQKIIEETPAVKLPDDVRKQIASDAVDLTIAVNYEGAGTVEFIMDADTFEYYFLEMNTRIQVEHPITEMCTGRDLVGMQLDFARGTMADIEQDQIKHENFSLECRIYAENPDINFVPSPGKLTRFELPQEDENTRIDCGFREGDEITYFYDPMIAKLITVGPDRKMMVDRMVEALKTFKVEGVKTNIDFLIKVLDHEAYRAQDIHTSFIDQHKSSLIGNS